jgi:hypothetical protein
MDPSTGSKPRLARRGAKWRPDNGKLIEWNEHEVRVIQPWPQPRCWSKRAEDGAAWVEVYGVIPDGVWGLTEKPLTFTQRARREAWATVPDEVQRLVTSCALVGGRWSALAMLARCAGADALARSIPVLAGALSCGRLFRKASQPWRSARALLAVPDGMARWQKIARWLGFDGSRAFVRVLRRLSTNGLAPFHLQALGEVWQHPIGKKRLLHAPRLGRDAIELLATAVRLGVVDRIHPELVSALATNARYESGLELWQHFEEDALLTTYQPDVVLEHLTRHWRRLRGRSPLPTFASTAELFTTYRALAQEVAEINRAEALPFPTCPLTTVPGITAIATSAGLIFEGRRMRHCIKNPSYISTAMRHGACAFHVDDPDESPNHQGYTLWITRSATAPCGFAHAGLFGVENSAPTEAARALVAGWLDHLNAAAAPLPADWAAVPPPGPEMLDDDAIPF